MNKFENCTDFEIWQEFANRFARNPLVDIGDPSFTLYDGTTLFAIFNTDGEIRHGVEQASNKENLVNKLLEQTCTGIELADTIGWLAKLYIENSKNDY